MKLKVISVIVLALMLFANQSFAEQEAAADGYYSGDNSYEDFSIKPPRWIRDRLPKPKLPKSLFDCVGSLGYTTLWGGACVAGISNPATSAITAAGICGISTSGVEMIRKTCR